MTSNERKESRTANKVLPKGVLTLLHRNICASYEL